MLVSPSVTICRQINRLIFARTEAKRQKLAFMAKQALGD